MVCGGPFGGQDGQGTFQRRGIASSVRLSSSIVVGSRRYHDDTIHFRRQFSSFSVVGFELCSRLPSRLCRVNNPRVITDQQAVLAELRFTTRNPRAGARRRCWVFWFHRSSFSSSCFLTPSTPSPSLRVQSIAWASARRSRSLCAEFLLLASFCQLGFRAEVKRG